MSKKLYIFSDKDLNISQVNIAIRAGYDVVQNGPINPHNVREVSKVIMSIIVNNNDKVAIGGLNADLLPHALMHGIPYFVFNDNPTNDIGQGCEMYVNNLDTIVWYIHDGDIKYNTIG